MKIKPENFFQAGETFKPFNLNELYLNNRTEMTNPSDPAQVQKVLAVNDLDNWTAGGYAEDRKDVWAETYLKGYGNFIHLGVDLNMRVWSTVLAPFDADIVDVYVDKDMSIGWGGRLILRRGDQYLVVAHLEPGTITGKLSVKAGEKLACVGDWPNNGNTFQHVHIQVLKDIKNPFDGYGSMNNLIGNPFEVEWEDDQPEPIEEQDDIRPRLQGETVND